MRDKGLSVTGAAFMAQESLGEWYSRARELFDPRTCRRAHPKYLGRRLEIRVTPPGLSCELCCKSVTAAGVRRPLL